MAGENLSASSDNSLGIFSDTTVDGNLTVGNVHQNKTVVQPIFININSNNSNTPQLIQQLEQILPQFKDSDIIRQIYRDSLPTDASLSRLEATNDKDILGQLQEFRRLSEFIQRLILNEQTPQYLRDQLEDITQKLSQTEGSKKPSIPQTENHKIYSYLQIVLRCDRSSDGFIISGWLIPDDSVHDPVKRFHPLDIEVQQKGTACQLEEIPTVLDKFLKLSLRHLVGKRYDLTVEAFLPMDYLCMDVDKWKLADPAFEGEHYVIGTKYRVIVRSQERLEPKYLDSRLNQWYANWDRVKSSWESVPNDTDFEHLDNLESCNWKRLVANLTQKLGLKLTCGLIEMYKKDLFTSVLKAASPVALWARGNCSDWDLATEMNKILLTNPMLELSEIIRKKRADADLEDQPEEYLGSHLSLLWEDPHRLTPDALAQLKPPGQ
jgi:hypothetical protein